MARRKRAPSAEGAVRRLMEHPGETAAITAEQIALRLIVVLPVVLHRTVPRLQKLPSEAALGAALLLYILLVLPLRFHGGEGLRALAGGEGMPKGGKPYSHWLRTGLIRHALSLVWALPLMLSVGYFVYGLPRLPFNVMWRPVLAITLRGSAALLVFFLLLAAYGWWRWMPAEYLPVRRLRTRDALFFVRRTRRRGRKELVQNALINCLLFLPAAAGFLLVLVPYVLDAAGRVTSAQLIIGNLMALLRKPLPRAQITQLLIVYLALYLPLCVPRKMRNAALVRSLTEEIGEDRHAAG